MKNKFIIILFAVLIPIIAFAKIPNAMNSMNFSNSGSWRDANGLHITFEVTISGQFEGWMVIHIYDTREPYDPSEDWEVEWIPPFAKRSVQNINNSKDKIDIFTLRDNILKINYEDDFSLKIFDINGNQKLEFINNKNQFNLDLSNGFYLFVFESNDITFTKKIIVDGGKK